MQRIEVLLFLVNLSGDSARFPVGLADKAHVRRLDGAYVLSISQFRSPFLRCNAARTIAAEK